MLPDQQRPSRESRSAALTVALHVLGVVLLSAYPVSLLLRANLGSVPIAPETVLSVLAADLSLVLLLYFSLRVVTADVAARIAWLAPFILVFGSYTIVLQVPASIGWRLLPERPFVATAYTCLAVAIATILSRPWVVRKRDPIPWLIVGVVLVGTNLGAGATGTMAFKSVTGQSNDWLRLANSLIAESIPSRTPVASPERDIYYIVLDGFGRPDVINGLYDLDLTDFVGFLREKGFYVPDRARSNYSQTYLSLASTLNLGYLDTIAAAMGPSSSERYPLAHLIDHNALMTTAKRAGYRVVGIGSDYTATENIPGADLCVCAQYGSGSTDRAMFATTPLVAVSLGSRAFEGHRTKVLNALSELARTANAPGPSFVFAHLIAPHPPFVFRQDGTEASVRSLFFFDDGSRYPGTREDYRSGYRDQVRFLTARVMNLVENLFSRSGPAPVIILHGDHGPGLMVDSTSVERSNTTERMSIFAAYYFPGETIEMYPTMTPLNGARLLANHYLQTELPLLQDRSYFSTWYRPYDLVRVDEPEHPEIADAPVSDEPSGGPSHP